MVTVKLDELFLFRKLQKTDIIPEVFCKKGVHKNFTKCSRNYLCRSLFSHTVARLGTLFKKMLWHICNRVSFANFLRTHIWTNYDHRSVFLTFLTEKIQKICGLFTVYQNISFKLQKRRFRYNSTQTILVPYCF